HPYRISHQNPAEQDTNGLLEIPMSVFPLGMLKIGFTGGLYLRALPLPLIETFIRRSNANGRPAVMYIHPWETYAATPRCRLSWGGRFILYYGLPSYGKLAKLLTQFRFGTMQQAFHDTL